MNLRRYQRFWLDFELRRDKLLLFRVVFFLLLGIDAFLQIEHAPRYGAGGFNVSHLPGLDWLLPEPGRERMLLVYLTQSFLSFLMVFGVGGRLTVGLITTLYGYAYFVSQLDSYQHHYLMFLVLLVLCFVPWRQVRDPDRPAVQSWALRLVLVQLSVLYFWAAISKMDGRWIDGSTLAQQIGVDWARGLIETLGGFGFAAVMVLLAELFLATAVPWRRLWPIALIVGVGFHVSVELAGFRIGLFSYFMVAMYLLVIPAGWVERARGVLAPGVEPIGSRLRQYRPGLAVIAGLVVLATGGVIAVVAMLPYAPMPRVAAAVVGILVVLVLAELRAQPLRAALARSVGALAFACVAVLMLDATTEQAFNYHKYWAGSARRLGADDEARAAYETLSRDFPEYGSGHYYLGRFQRQAGDEAAALESFERAVKASPDDYRPALEAALLYHRAGRGVDALRAAQHVVDLKPDNPQHLQLAERLVRRWENAP